MGQDAAVEETRQSLKRDGLLRNFARIMRERYKARVYVFGSRARGTQHEYSDYDLVAVSPAFRGQSRFSRCLDRGQMWLAAGGWRKALDLHCYTPEEFRAELRGLGYLAQARDRGELVMVRPAARGRLVRPQTTSR